MKYKAYRLIPLLCMLLLTACGSKLEIESHIASNIPQQPKKIFVVLRWMPAWANRSQEFQTAFADGIRACGSDVKFFNRPSEDPNLSLKDSDETITQMKQGDADLIAYQPNVVFVIGQKQHIGAYSRYEFVLRDFKTHKLLWSGAANNSATEGDKLALAVIDRMNRDKILLLCPTKSSDVQ